YGMGKAGEALNPTHGTKKMDDEDVRAFRDRFQIPVTDKQLENGQVPFYHPGKDSPEVEYMLERRRALGGFLPQRRRKAKEQLEVPPLKTFERLLKDTGDRHISTTMAFVQMLNIALRDKQVGPRLVPMDADQLMYYREDAAGQVLQEGITEAGAFASWLAAATSYSTNDLQLLPFYIYYSMFGFQRVGDAAWQAGDMRARGFLLGATAGRT